MKPLERILHAEDDVDIQFLLELSFETRPEFVYHCCDNGEVLLSQVHDFQPDLIVLDMMMPRLNGLETLDKLKEDSRTRDIPVIFLTAKIQPEEVSHYQKRGAFAILFKPIELTSLPDQLKALWQSYHEQQGSL